MNYDLIIIGGGPAGYSGAIRAAQLGFKTACIEKGKTLGGTCLNIGCIPSKALLEASHRYETVMHSSNFGIEVKSVNLDFTKVMKNKQDVVDTLTKGIEQLFKKNKVDRILGEAKFVSSNTVEVAGVSYSAKHIIIATGSEPISIPNVTIDEKIVVSSTGALSLNKIPKDMVIIGAGVIGLELGSVYKRFGSNVTMIEYADLPLAGMDNDIRKSAMKIFEKQGIEFKVSSKVTGCKVSNGTATVSYEEVNAAGKAHTIKADIVLVATGRAPFTKGLNLEKAGVKTDARGFVLVDQNYSTTTAGVYAVGDVIGGLMLAHKSEEEAVVLVERLAGSKEAHVQYTAIPGVVYTYPEVASVGYTEEQLKQFNIPYKVGKFPMLANARARTSGNTDGFVKLIVHAQSGVILGSHAIGIAAGEFIQECVLAIASNKTAKDLAHLSHSHPGFSESVKEAAMATLGYNINI